MKTRRNMRKAAFGSLGKLRSARVFLILPAVAAFLLCRPALPWAQSTDINDVPLETQGLPAPPNIMFVLDNSGSMDWEMMTEESNGKFTGGSMVYEYLYPAGDHNYTDSSNGTILKDKAPGYWKSQWSGYNKIFFNPQVDYQPWPGQKYPPGIVDLTAVRSNPWHDKWHVDLTKEFMEVGLSILDVDEELSGSGFTRSAYGWDGMTYSGAQNDYYFFTYGAIPEGEPPAWARWTPNLPGGGEYEVRVWWRGSISGRATDVCYTIHHNGDTATKCGVNQLDNPPEDGYSLGTFKFSGNGEEYVELVAVEPGDNKYAADAVRFIGTTGVSISIKYAHYYTWDDTDDDGTLNDGDGVYLVNFVWTDDGDKTVESDELARHYYRFSDSGTEGKVETGELQPVWESSMPPSVKARFWEEDGTEGEPKTIEEDLENFINWFSFYRRRELTAKAAVAHSIMDLEWVKVGFYTINYDNNKDSDPDDDFGVRTEVLPIKAPGNGDETIAYTVVDNKDTGAYLEADTSKWSELKASNEYKGSSRYTGTVGASATWRPHIEEPGNHDVFVWYPKTRSKRDKEAKYIVHHNEGSTEFTVNQRVKTGEWVLLGTLKFSGDGTEYIELIRNGNSYRTNGSYTIADAVKLEWVPTNSEEGLDDQLDTLLKYLYGIDSAGGTPLRKALDAVGRYYDEDEDSPLGDSPYAPDNLDDPDKGGACQHAFCIAMTDGFWNGDPPGVGNQDGASEDPYGDAYSNTLADVAMKYYKNDLVSPHKLPPEGNDAVPTSTCDNAYWQHMVTYTVSFGVAGSINPKEINGNDIPDADEDGVTSYREDPCFQNDTTPKPDWPNPEKEDPQGGDSYKIDDLFHAAVNGRGMYLNASDPQELVMSLKAVIENMANRTASGASVSVNGEELSEGSMLYLARYTAGVWEGEVVAYPLNPESGAIGETYEWNAAEALGGMDWNTDRNIVTYDESKGEGIPFRRDDLTPAQAAALLPEWEKDENRDARLQNIVDHLRGKADIEGFRYRKRILGDVVHSAPVLLQGPINKQGEREPGTIFAGGNDGMLHAFNAEDGTERFAYVPNILFRELMQFKEKDLFPDVPEASDSNSRSASKLRALTLPEYNNDHQFYVDLTPTVRRIYDPVEQEVRAILVGGLGKGGRGYFALEVTDVAAVTGEQGAADLVLWEYPDPGQTDPDMGYSYSQAFVIKTNKYVESRPQLAVVFGNGYNSNNGEAVLYVVLLDQNLAIQKVMKIDTSGELVTGLNGLSTPLPVDVDGDFRVDYVYAGDLKGNLWKFDFTGTEPEEWEVAFGTKERPQPLFTAQIRAPGDGDYCDPEGDNIYPQAITTQPAVMYHCLRPRKHGYIVTFGTGRYLGKNDLESNDFVPQTIYGIWDFGDDEDNDEYLGAFERKTGSLSNLDADVTLLEQTQVYWDQKSEWRLLSDNKPNWGTKEDEDKNEKGEREKPNPSADETDEKVAHVGWYFDLPGYGALDCTKKPLGERVIKDYLIRSGALIILSMVPSTDRCSGGGNSMFHEMDACSGGRITNPYFDGNSTTNPPFDSNRDGKMDDKDLIELVGTDGKPIFLSPTSIKFVGIVNTPVAVRSEKGDQLIFTDSSGKAFRLKHENEKRGVFYWRDVLEGKCVSGGGGSSTHEVK